MQRGDAGNMAEPVKDKKPQVQNEGGSVGQAGGDTDIGHLYKIGEQCHQFPKLPSFFGEEKKGECKWDVFKHEVESAMSDGVHLLVIVVDNQHNHISTVVFGKVEYCDIGDKDEEIISRDDPWLLTTFQGSCYKCNERGHMANIVQSQPLVQGI